MRTNRMLLVGALGVMLGALPARDAGGQAPTPGTGGRPAAEVFYSQLRLDGGGRTLPADGVGMRLTWGAATEPSPGLLGRSGIGFFAGYTPARRFGAGARYSTFSVGA